MGVRFVDKFGRNIMIGSRLFCIGVDRCKQVSLIRMEEEKTAIFISKEDLEAKE